jgi:hypothetical protein
VTALTLGAVAGLGLLVITMGLTRPTVTPSDPGRFPQALAGVVVGLVAAVGVWLVCGWPVLTLAALAGGLLLPRVWVRRAERLCCVLPSCGRLKPQSHSVSDRLGKLVKRDRQPPGRWLLDRKLVVPSTNVLDEGMSRDDHPGAAVSLEASHRPQPGLEASVIGLDVVVGIPLSAMPRRWQQLLQHHRVGGCPVGHDFTRPDRGCADSPLEEPASCSDVAPRGDEDVNHLPELTNGAVDIAPLAGDLHVDLVDLLAVAIGMSAGPGSLGQQAGEVKHPP